jgi:hypothetical protein
MAPPHRKAFLLQTSPALRSVRHGAACCSRLRTALRWRSASRAFGWNDKTACAQSALCSHSLPVVASLSVSRLALSRHWNQLRQTFLLQ